MEVIYDLVRPDKTSFDMATLVQELDALPFVFRNPVGLAVKLHPDEITFAVAPTPEYAQLEQTRFDAGWYQMGGPYTLGSITIRPTFITVNQFTGQTTLDQMQHVLVPIMERYDCQIINEYNLDITDRYRPDLTQLFGD